MAASAARSTVSRSGCLPNLVIWMPRIQTSSLALIADSFVAETGSKPNPTASVPSESVPIEWVARRTFMPSKTCSGSGSTLMRLARTWVPPQSTTAATNGVGIPGAANATMVNARTVPSVAIGTVANSVAKHLAHALRRSKYLEAQLTHSCATKCG